jgi:hypothetical protein
MKVSRPVLTVVSSPSGKSFAWEATAPSWNVELQSTAHFDTEAGAKAHGKAFSKSFDVEATKMENGTTPRRNMIAELADHGIVKTRIKLSDSFAKLRI